MAKPPSLPLDHDENDGFDWEAAVREIDNACHLSSVSTISTDHHQGQGFYLENQDQDFVTPVAGTAAAAAATAATSNFCQPKGKGRQSTLDRFVDSFAAKRAKRNGESATMADGGKNDYERIEEGGEPTAVKIDLEAAKTWIYPINVPLRDYQFSIAKSALFSNTLVALPTGLGKTLIAAVVMYNYFRWFPEGKIVFTAPSRPLVMQQVEACHNIVGIPQDWTIDMTGQMSPKNRSSYWKSKRVFFVTPQILEKDIQSGICLIKQLVCLVIDEAHRALGNYSYCVAVRELLAVPVRLRILALTATPGSKQGTIQNVINNLCISTLEYRNESDHDVSPYVHNRKLELIKVPLSEDAIKINNLILEAIRPFVARLCANGVLYNKDIAMLSPCELLNSRDKFRQAPPSTLPHAKYGEVEGYFGVLITLYHLRKLLSSHGIRPAYEMLEEKLKQGSFSRMMSRNETIWKAKLLMQQCLSHGAPNPKLMKLIEILIDHFKTKDPKDSRVIIFSNFRGSVKDIIDSLSAIGNLVKATEFIGQSSGKTLKGQTQKMQQAVLQKFRAGGFNVIVATSIGEEGLDIMEVDLVICFDANVSPLRMIQRMGRTGRKHDGRVVVLACEGTELKGYLKKEASSKVVRKHMHNGGIRSFNFHASPRMIPHVCRPEVQYVELSIEQFVPRGRKTKDDAPHQSPVLRKISFEQKALIARYFNPHEQDIWRPSLIAFPSFQVFPSRVHNVRHSFKTTAMLIDAMQRLQGLSFSRVVKAPISKVQTSSQSFTGVITAHDDTKEDDLLQRGPSAEAPCLGTLPSKDEHQKSPSHRFLFGGDFVAINGLGSVSILSVPTLPLKGSILFTTNACESISELSCKRKNEARSIKASAVQNSGLHLQLGKDLQVAVSTEFMCASSRGISPPQSPNFVAHLESESSKVVLQIPVSKHDLIHSEDSVAEMPDVTKKDNPAQLVGDTREVLRNMELSPRLTHFVVEGIVPESPIAASTPEYESPAAFQKNFLMNLASCSAILSDSLQKELIEPEPPCSMKPLSGFPVVNGSTTATGTTVTPQTSPLNRTPLVNPVSNSSSEDWQMSSGGILKSVSQAPKYKRLHKYGDKSGNLAHRAGTRLRPNKTVRQGTKERAKKYVNDFIEEEAEVSEDAEFSADEEDNETEDEFEDSFIDDRTNPTASSAQAGDSGRDMMAFYRRSLLTQSPLEVLPKCLLYSYNSASSRAGGSGSCLSEKINSSHETPRSSSPSTDHSIRKNSVTCELDAKEVTLVTGTDDAKSNIVQKECSSKLVNRKRKLSFQHSCSIPAGNFQAKDLPLEQSGKLLLDDNPGSFEVDNDLSFDDEFYQSLDLDAVEAQATELLRCKTGLPSSNIPAIFPNDIAGRTENLLLNPFSHPSFDLGL